MPIDFPQTVSLRDYLLRFEGFEGPIDLLLQLIRRNELDICDVSITLIARQYHQYLEVMKSFDLRIASDFLLIAATLAYIKSQRLLPTPPAMEREIDQLAEDFTARMRESHRYREATHYFARQHRLRQRIWTSADVIADRPTNGEPNRIGLDILELLEAFRQAIASTPQTVLNIAVKGPSVEEQIALLQERFQKPRALSFPSLFRSGASLSELIATFLALLELIRIGFLRISQPSSFGEIRIYRE